MELDERLRGILGAWKGCLLAGYMAREIDYLRASCSRDFSLLLSLGKIDRLGLLALDHSRRAPRIGWSK
jgi:hypothetical protein